MTGCALTPDTTPIGYRPANLQEPVQGAENVPVRVVVNDQRLVRDRVGVKKNGYGMEMAPIHAANDVPELVQRAIETALEERGFKVGDAGLQVRVELIKFLNDFKVGFWTGTAAGELIMNVEVRTGGDRVLFSKSIVGQGLNSGEVIMGGSGAKTALELALQDGVAKLVNDPGFTEALLDGRSRPGIASNRPSRLSQDRSELDRFRNVAYSPSSWPWAGWCKGLFAPARSSNGL